MKWYLEIILLKVVKLSHSLLTTKIWAILRHRERLAVLLKSCRLFSERSEMKTWTSRKMSQWINIHFSSALFTQQTKLLTWSEPQRNETNEFIALAKRCGENLTNKNRRSLWCWDRKAFGTELKAMRRMKKKWNWKPI